MKISAKVMRSFDYCHFEVALEDTVDGFENIMNPANKIRIMAAQLVDKAVQDYQALKAHENRKLSFYGEYRQLQSEVEEIMKSPEESWSILQKAKVKALKDHEWNKQFEYDEEDQF